MSGIEAPETPEPVASSDGHAPTTRPAIAGAGGGRTAATLLADGIAVHFEGVTALDGVTLELRESEILGLIGPNGAGKTTLVNVLSGFQSPVQGSVALNERDVTSWPPARLASHGIARTFQAVRLFPGLTVLQNVELGAMGVGLSQRRARDRAWDLLAQLHLEEKAHHLADALPHGEERLIGVARALATGPRFLLLDEPGAGLNEAESAELVRTLKSLRDHYSLGLLVIEHDMELIMGLCDRIQVLDHGVAIAIGTPKEIRQDEAVLAAYLGG